jgi:hypothetical protein
MQNLIARLSVSPGRIRFTGRARGADTDAVLADELGLETATLADLRARDIIG